MIHKPGRALVGLAPRAEDARFDVISNAHVATAAVGTMSATMQRPSWKRASLLLMF